MDSDEYGPFTATVLKWANDAVTIRPSSLKDKLYHYTDAGGLFGMLQSGEVWLTDYRFLNDKSEFTYSLEIVDSIKKEIISTGEPEGDFGEVLANAGSQDLRGSDATVFSLSEERDDLSQWRGYARDGMGFTIGFDAHKIFELSEDQDASFAFAQVNYDGKHEAEVYRKSLTQLRAELAKAIAKKPSDKADLVRLAIEGFDYICLNRGLTSKHKSFRSENEWRLISYLYESDETFVRVSGNNLVPYSKLKLGKLLPIVEIGIGPGFSGSEVVDAVRPLANRAGYDPVIYFADTPYRRM